MSNLSRRKGRDGENEVRTLLAEAGLHVEALGGRTDQPDALLAATRIGVVIVEVKRQETARPWQWWQQATDSAHGLPTVVAFRRSRSRWLALVDLEQLAKLLP
jgi:hypothetical protein